MFARKDMVVLVRDRIRTLSFAVMGECACASVNGLKLRMVETILLATEALLFTREPRLFRVAVTMRASLSNGQTQLSYAYKQGHVPAVVLNDKEQSV